MPKRSICHISGSSSESKDSEKRVRIDCDRPLLTPVRFLILSDTHGANLPSSLPPCDVLFHCGDLTEDGTPESIFAAIRNLSKVKAKLRLVIAGNHDISLDKEYWVSQGGAESDSEIVQALFNPECGASKHGIIFLSEGIHTLNLPCGAVFKIYASPYTPGCGTSAFQYPTGSDRFNPPETTPLWAKNVGTETSIIPENVDIVMTHGPPKYILGETAGDSAGCEHLRNAIVRVKPRLHCFGHIHLPREGWTYQAHRLAYKDPPKPDSGEPGLIATIFKDWVGSNQARKKGFRCLPPGSAEDFRASKQQTLCVNAAMEGEKGELEHPPWLVTLDLPVRR
ncbi:hypothetical protein COCMIDRAFT_100669 [Bipolaris oryzae ATCC 44560]|uniref:Calcineurin-like phosphoesterase domain-containing protein n=1 Tax=Bipolaris oryzae ATCC 44560 TaxID=930090 RepID=W6YVN4_COCMI|nr:uncharacterized protein COCMIDRAFT_100669 [Bipolaris oryzae ATCC 44560]EUC43487.1 hypothetical protein COCMIDRAFT_100669 [Bipolaris oryzae ATCC 44560]